MNISDHDASIVPENLYVSANYEKILAQESNPEGDQLAQINITGKNLTQTLDCKNCHKEDQKSVGPAFILVSKKYAKDPKAPTYLSAKIRSGGSGVWGQVAMAAHPDITQSDLDHIISWIFSLSNKESTKKSLPQEGNIIPPPNEKPDLSLVISASYTNKGGDNIKPLSGNTSISLNSNNYSFTGKEKLNGFTVYNSNGKNYLVIPSQQGWFEIEHIDLTGVRSLDMNVCSNDLLNTDFPFEIKLDGPDGKLIGKGSVKTSNKKSKEEMGHLIIEPVTDNNFHNLYFVYKPISKDDKVQAGIASVKFNAR